MPPDWAPLAAVLTVIVSSALRMLMVQAIDGVKAYGFGRHAAIQQVAERNWRLAVAAMLGFSALPWLAPEWETAIGLQAWSGTPALRWTATGVLAASVCLIILAQAQMGASWRIGVPEEGPGALVAHGVFRWSRNPIFTGMIAGMTGVFLWSPHIGTAAVLAATWTLVLIQVRIEEEALREKHGEAYERYAHAVPRWLGWPRSAPAPH